MADLANLKLGADINADDRDSLGGAYTWDSGVYKTTVDMAYIDKSNSGATGLFLTFKEGSNTLKNTFWVISSDAKGNRAYYEDKRTGDKRPLPGMSQANALCFLTLGLDLGDLTTEEKMVNIYDYDAKEERPTKVDVVMDLLNKEVNIGVIKRVVNKNVKNDQGVYVPSSETRQENEVDKIFQTSTNLTSVEMKAGKTVGEFITGWSTKWTGVTQDKSTGGTAAGTPGAPGASATPSLF